MDVDFQTIRNGFMINRNAFEINKGTLKGKL